MSVCDSETALLQANPTARSELDVLKQRITELEAELEKKNVEIFDLNNENQKLRKELESRIEELEKDRADTDAENIKRDAENAELKVRVAKLEQDSSVVDVQSQDAEDGKVFLLRGRFAGPEATKSPAISLGVSSKKLQRELTAPEMPSVTLNAKEAKFSTEDDPINAFLIEQHKKSVGEEIRQRNREKKLLHESANQEASSISQDIPVITTSQENNDDDIEFTKSQVIEQELTKELLSGIISAPSISFEATERIPSVSHPSSSLDTTQNLVHLFQNAIRAGHEVILSWLYYSNSFENKVDEIRHDTGASDKTARSQIYKEMLEHLPGITLGNLRMRTLRAKKIRMLFGEGGGGIDKIKQVTFSVYDISSLTINQIQSVIKNVTSAERIPEVPNT